MAKKGAKKIPEWKKEEVKDILRLVNEYPIFGIVDLENLPALQLQRIRIKLEAMLDLKMTKKRLIKIALQQLKDKPEIEKVIESMRGMPAIIFTKENPFKLYKTLAQNKSKAPAKPGQTAPNDIMIPAGPTQFTPGPIISELAQVGIKTKVEEGKLTVTEDVVLIKEGEKITNAQADILSRFGIEPMEVGLNIVLIYENGTIYQKSILAVDEEEYLNNLRTASANSTALAMEIGYVTPETVTLMIQKAYRETKAVTDSADILTDEKVGTMMGQANIEMEAIRTVANITEEVVKEAKEEKKEEKKQEEVVKEEKTEEKKEEEKQEEVKEEKTEEKKEEEKQEEVVKEEKTEEKKEEEKQEEVKEEKTEEKKEEFKEDFRTEKGPSAAEVLKEVENEEKEQKSEEERKKVEELAKNIMAGKS